MDDELIQQEYSFKARNMLNERVKVGVSFTEIHVNVSIVSRMILYCTIYVETVKGKKQYYHGGTVWNGEDKFDPNGAIFRAFSDALVRRFAKECHENDAGSNDYRGDFENYRDGWCKAFWSIMNGGKRGNHHPNFF